MEPITDRCWRLLAALRCCGVDRVGRLAPAWESRQIHRHSVPTVVISVVGATALETGAQEVLAMPAGRIALIAPWTWHTHPQPHGQGISLVLGQCGPLADFWLLQGDQGPWWGEGPLAPLAPLLARLEQAAGDGVAAGQALIDAIAAQRPGPAPAGGPLRRLCAFAWLNRTLPITAAQMLASSGLAYANAHRLFVRRFGTTPKRYLLDCRLGLARHLLESGAQPGQVWQECGFRSRADLTRRMRLDTGRPPRAWRPRRRRPGHQR